MKSKIITIQVNNPTTYDPTHEPYLKRQIDNGFTIIVEQKPIRTSWIDSILSHA